MFKSHQSNLRDVEREGEIHNRISRVGVVTNMHFFGTTHTALRRGGDCLRPHRHQVRPTVVVDCVVEVPTIVLGCLEL